MTNRDFEAARTIMAVRDYDAQKLPDDVLRRIQKAGRLAASGGNGQPWHFVVVRSSEGLRKLGTLVRTGPYVARAAAAVIVAYEKDKGAMGLSDATRAIQTMMLTAWSDGVGSNWTGFTASLENVRKEFGFPDTYQVIAVVPLGYPRRKVIGRKKRKAFDDVVSAERFGAPLT